MKFLLHRQGIRWRELRLRPVRMMVMSMAVMVGMLIPGYLHQRFVPGFQHLSPHREAILVHLPGLPEAVERVAEARSLPEGRRMPFGGLGEAWAFLRTRHGGKKPQQAATCA